MIVELGLVVKEVFKLVNEVLAIERNDCLLLTLLNGSNKFLEDSESVDSVNVVKNVRLVVVGEVVVSLVKEVLEVPHLLDKNGFFSQFLHGFDLFDAVEKLLKSLADSGVSVEFGSVDLEKYFEVAF